LVFISHFYHESPRGELFFETQCISVYRPVICVALVYNDISP